MAYLLSLQQHGLSPKKPGSALAPILNAFKQEAEGRSGKNSLTGQAVQFGVLNL